MATRSVRPIRIEGNIAFITLSKGYEAVIDAADAPLVSGFNWSAVVAPHTVYASRMPPRRSGSRRAIFLHRLILGVPDGIFGDHIDGNGLNNRRSNLRPASGAENQRNRRISITNTSGFKGVSWHKNRAKWQANITTAGRQIHLGLFETAEEAHASYIAAANKFHGDFANAG